MANISTSNSTYTTGGIDSRSTLNGTSEATFQQMNGVASAAVAIETVLGDGPTLRGNLADLVARLAVALDANGHVKMTTSDAVTGLTDLYGLIASGTNLLVSRNIAPIGAVIMWAGSSVPAHWVILDGSAISRTTYATLFAVWGVTFGVGDGSTTFNVPDLRGRVPMGVDNMGGSAANRVTAASTNGGNSTSLGGAGGTETHTLTTTEMPAHTHPGTAAGDTSDGGGGGASFARATNSTTPGGDTLTNINNFAAPSQGGGGAHSNTQPWIALNFIAYAGA